MANQIRMRTQLWGGDPGLAGQMQAGQSPPGRGGKDCCVAPRAQAQLSLGQKMDGASPTRQDPPVPTPHTLSNKPTRALLVLATAG